ncbi:MAG TPA: IncP-type conjugal transfer protein TraG [Polyangia bacterium]|nr:IncP-type conjugal transfer protein TraG [Polyangia bacterium]
MKRRGMLLVLLLGAVGVTAVGFTLATGLAASRLGYQTVLGDPVAMGGLHVYAPWSWMRWDSDFGAYAPQIFRIVRVIGWSSFLVGWLPLIVASISMARRRPASTAHGSAAWGDESDLQAAGLLGGEGVVLCQTSDARYAGLGKPGAYRMLRAGRLITHDGPEHVMVFAPTRSGKGIGTVIPTLLSWRHSALVYDIKKELWTRTAGWRRQFSRCWRFEPTAADSIRFNPLLEVRQGPGEVRDVQNIADILVDPDGSEKRDHWKTSAHTLLSGAILHVLYAEPEKSLTAVARLLSNPDSQIYDTFQRMLVTRHLPSGRHPVVAQYAREMLDKSENELAGIVSTAKTCLNLYNDPLIARNTGTSDFRISELMNARDPVSLYLVVPPSDIDRTRPLIRLLLNQIGRRLTERMEFGEKPGYRHRLLVLLDEFPSLGKLSFFETQLAYLAGYGIKAFLIAQSLNQLQAAYGQNNSILDNCHVRLTYTANDDRTARRISDLIGQATHTKLARSYSGGGFFRNVNHSEQEHGRPLLTPDEILRLPYEDALLLVGGMAPYRGRKVMYYTDARFKGRVDRPTPDNERQRRGELLGTREASDWERARPPATPASSGAPAAIAAGHSSNAPPDREAQEAAVPPPIVSQAKPGDEAEGLGVGAFAAFFRPDSDQPGAAPPAGGGAPTSEAPRGEDDIPL